MFSFSIFSQLTIKFGSDSLKRFFNLKAASSRVDKAFGSKFSGRLIVA